MPLIACPDCGKQISSSATSCVHCGCPVASILYGRELERIRQQEEAYFQDLPRLAPDLERYILSTLLNGIAEPTKLKYYHPKLFSVDFNIDIFIDELPQHLRQPFRRSTYYRHESQVREFLDNVLLKVQQELRQRYPRGAIMYQYTIDEYIFLITFFFSGDHSAFM